MKLLFLCYFILNSLPDINLQFTNKDPNSTFSKFEVVGEKTIVYQRNGKEIRPVYTFNQVPSNIHNVDMRSTYKMTVVETIPKGKLTVEIGYTLYRETNMYSGYLKIKTDYSDAKPSLTTTDYFEIKS